MPEIINGRHLFNEIPEGYPIPGRTTIYDTSQKIDLDNVKLDGGFLIKTLALSIDPYLRGKMRSAEKESYSLPFHLGEPLYNQGIAVVVRSENPKFKVGDHVCGIITFEEYSIQHDADKLFIVENKENLPWSAFVGVVGMPGQTAYVGWKEYAHPKKGDVAFITTGGGPVGSFVIQLAKQDGLKVIASAGSDDKVEFMKSIGADVAFNYKKVNTREVLKKEGPINIYWDNVGGETLESALEAAATFSRFIMCGAISTYNTKVPYHIKNLMHIVSKQLSLNGFIVSTLLPKYRDAFFKETPALVASGKLKYTEDITYGLDKVGEAILAVQSGTNTGKSVVVVAKN